MPFRLLDLAVKKHVKVFINTDTVLDRFVSAYAMIECLKNNEPVIDLTPGEQQRDFVYYEDIISAFEIVIDKNDTVTTGSTFRVGSGETISIKELMLFLKKYMGANSRLNFGAIPYQANELMLSETNLEPLKSLGWKPEYTIKEGLLKTIKKLYN
jgi:nucleoside-diphosphate-sugar epimerase